MENIELRLNEGNARQLERFLQGFLSTHKFQSFYVGSEIKAFNELYSEIRKALGHVSDQEKK